MRQNKTTTARTAGTAIVALAQAAKRRLPGALVALSTAVCLAAPAHAGTVFSTDFEGARPAQITGWDLEAMGSGSDGSFSSYGFSGSQWLRNSGPNTTATLTLSGLGAHTSISLDFLMALLDSIDSNDTFSVRVDGVTVFTQHMTTWNVGPTTAGTVLVSQKQLAGTNGQPWSIDSGYDMSSVAALHNIAHTASTVTIDFVGGFDESKSNEGVAIDNLRVSVQAVPEPASAGLVALALAGLAALGRRRRAGTASDPA